MSGLYNLLFGVEPLAGTLLSALEVHAVDVPRFRDCFFILQDEEPRIVIYTLTGGGNREDYVDGIAMLRALPGFIRDYDDDFDSTYAHFEYRMPDSLRELFDVAGPAMAPAEKFKLMIDALQKQGSKP